MKLLSAYTKRTAVSLSLWLALTGITAIAVFGMTRQKPFDVISAFDVMLDLSSYRKLIMLFAMLPFGTVYCREFNTGLSVSISTRKPVNKQLRAYIIMQFFSALLVTLTALFISLAIMRIRLPLYYDVGNVRSGAFDSLVSGGKPAAYLLFRCLHYSVSIAAWSMSGLMMSAVFLDSYLAVISPLVFSYGLEFLTIQSGVFPDLWHLSLSYTDFSQSAAASSAYICGVFILIAVLFSGVFYFLARRRMSGEIR